ncbi:gliding motility-associated C-terminal domain-containing protein, partial [bacterium]|nr:gliding motility-associated C-terminal domain-containing protein [bacterium]
IAFYFVSEYDLLTDSLGLVIGDTLRLVSAFSPPGLIVHGDTVEFNLPGTFASGDTVWFEPIGRDIYLNPAASVRWFFVVDTDPPTTELLSPASPNYDWLAEISVIVEDELAGVDWDTVAVDIITPRGNWHLEADSVGMAIGGDTIWIDPDEVNGHQEWTPEQDSALLYFHEDETTYVVVSACDRAQLCGANCSAETLWFYTGDDDTVPPEIAGWTPESAAAGTEFNLTISAADPSGLGPCCFAVISGETLEVSISAVGEDTFALTVEDIPAPLPGETLWTEIHLCDDDHDFLNDSDRATTVESVFVVGVFSEGPTAEFIQPLEGEYTSCDSGPVVAVLSDPDGISRDNTVFIADGETLAVEWRGDTAFIYPHHRWQNGDEVAISLAHCEDALGNPGDTISLNFVVDTQPPEITLTSPDTGIVFDLSAVEFEIEDELSGVSEAYLVVAGDTIALAGGVPVDLSGYAVPGETLWIEATACDNALWCGNNCATQSFWFLPALQTPCDAYPIPFTPNGDGVNDVIYFDFPGMVKDGATVTILTAEGVLVRRIELSPALPHTSAFWDGTDENGNPVPPGIYIYFITRNGSTLCKGSISLAR